MQAVRHPHALVIVRNARRWIALGPRLTQNYVGNNKLGAREWALQDQCRPDQSGTGPGAYSESKSPSCSGQLSLLCLFNKDSIEWSHYSSTFLHVSRINRAANPRAALWKATSRIPSQRRTDADTTFYRSSSAYDVTP